MLKSSRTWYITGIVVVFYYWNHGYNVNRWKQTPNLARKGVQIGKQISVYAKFTCHQDGNKSLSILQSWFIFKYTKSAVDYVTYCTYIITLKETENIGEWNGRIVSTYNTGVRTVTNNMLLGLDCTTSAQTLTAYLISSKRAIDLVITHWRHTVYVRFAVHSACTEGVRVNWYKLDISHGHSTCRRSVVSCGYSGFLHQKTDFIIISPPLYDPGCC